MADDERKGKRQIVGFALIGSAVFMFVFAGLVHVGVLPMTDYSRPLLTSILSIVAVFDLVLAAYFLLSNPS
jgi:hypothetical protein